MTCLEDRCLCDIWLEPKKIRIDSCCNSFLTWSLFMQRLSSISMVPALSERTQTCCKITSISERTTRESAMSHGVLPLLVGALVAGCSTASASGSRAVTNVPGLTENEYSVVHMMKVRCSANGTETFYEWHGSVFSFVPGEKQRLLFKVLGMNVARCKPSSNGNWLVLSRERFSFILTRKQVNLYKSGRTPGLKKFFPLFM